MRSRGVRERSAAQWPKERAGQCPRSPPMDTSRRTTSRREHVRQDAVDGASLGQCSRGSSQVAAQSRPSRDLGHTRCDCAARTA